MGNLSKHVLKKMAKNKQKEEEQRKKEEKAAKLAAMSNSQSENSQAVDDEDMDPTQFFENRLKSLTGMKETGINPYNSISSLLRWVYQNIYRNMVESTMVPTSRMSITSRLFYGRIMSKRSSSSKLFFYDLHWSRVKVQVMADARSLSWMKLNFQSSMLV